MGDNTDALLSAGELENTERLLRSYAEEDRAQTWYAATRLLAACRAQEAKIADLRAQVERQAAENEGLKLLLEGRIVPDVDALLRGVVSAWEALGEGDWPPSLIENWLRTSMWPAVNAVRTCLTAEPRKDDGATLPLPPDLGERK